MGGRIQQQRPGYSSTDDACIAPRAPRPCPPCRHQGRQVRLGLLKRGDEGGPVGDGVEAALVDEAVADGGQEPHAPEWGRGGGRAEPMGVGSRGCSWMKRLRMVVRNLMRLSGVGGFRF